MNRLWFWAEALALFAVAALAALLFALPSRAGWGGTSCGPVGPAPAMLPAAPAAPSYSWERYPDGDSRYWALMSGGRQLGTYTVADKEYRELLGSPNLYGNPCTPPVPPPADAASRARGCPCGCDRCKAGCVCQADARCGPGCSCGLNFGLDCAKIEQGKTSISGREVSKEQGFAAITANVPSDANMPRLTLIGTEADCKRVLSDLDASPALSPLKGHFLVQDYRPADWPTQCGFKTDGSPEVYVQAADGKVLHRQDGYDGPEALASALRKVDPLYRPANDPNVNASGDWLGQLYAWAQKNPLAVVFAVVVLFAILWLRGKKP